MEEEDGMGRALHMGHNLLGDPRQSSVGYASDIDICIGNYSAKVIGIGYTQRLGQDMGREFSTRPHLRHVIPCMHEGRHQMSSYTTCTKNYHSLR